MSTFDEKDTSAAQEKSLETPTYASDDLSDVVIDPAIERRILRKLDFRVVPVLWFLFLVSFVDRGNIANANIQGMPKDLHFKGDDYNIAVWIFTLAYVVFGVPANIIFRLVGPKSLSVMMFLWGLTVLGQGLTKTWGGLVACRFLEGICEAGFVPGAAYLIGSYYKKNEFLKRYAVFFSAAIIAGAFNGLFSTLLAKMTGVAGYDGWRWIFIIESLITIVVSAVSFFFIVPFPEKSTMFTPEEKRVLLARLRLDAGLEPTQQGYKAIFTALLDWKIWLATAAYVGAEENASSVVAFQPTILKGIGYTSTGAQVHSIPVYIVAFVLSLTCCALSERLRMRYAFAMFGVVLTTIGLAIELAQPKSAHTRYAGMFFVCAGPYIIMPILVVWTAINVGKGFKRTVALGCVIAVGNCGAFVSSNVFITKQAPKYHTGFSVGMAWTWISGAAMTVLFFGLWLENRKRDRAQVTERVEDSVEDVGERHPDFRYQL